MEFVNPITGVWESVEHGASWLVTIYGPELSLCWRVQHLYQVGCKAGSTSWGAGCQPTTEQPACSSWSGHEHLASGLQTATTVTSWHRVVEEVIVDDTGSDIVVSHSLIIMIM